MDPHNRHRRSPSSDRFIAVFSPPSADPSAFSSGDELSEVDVFYNDSEHPSPPRTAPSPAVYHRPRRSFLKQEKFGILAALPEERRPDVVRKPAAPSSPSTASFARDIPSIPKPHAAPETSRYSQSMPIRRFQQSAPVKIPMAARRPRGGVVEEGEEEVLPPHEIVARGSMRSEMTTFSVLEGAGRTLKGRDLRQVRNAVWRQTGFLD